MFINVYNEYVKEVIKIRMEIVLFFVSVAQESRDVECKQKMLMCKTSPWSYRTSNIITPQLHWEPTVLVVLIIIVWCGNLTRYNIVFTPTMGDDKKEVIEGLGIAIESDDE